MDKPEKLVRSLPVSATMANGIVVDVTIFHKPFDSTPCGVEFSTINGWRGYSLENESLLATFSTLSTNLIRLGEKLAKALSPVLGPDQALAVANKIREQFP